MVPHIRGPRSCSGPVAVAIAVLLLVLVAPTAAVAAVPSWLDRQAGWHGRGIERPLAPQGAGQVVSASMPRTVSFGVGLGSADGSGVVRRVQRALRELGYGVGRVDGRFGPRTRSAVGWFQRKHGLTVDGIAGPRTLQRLRERERVDSTTDAETQARAEAPP
jgi:hypothetical protein